MINPLYRLFRSEIHFSRIENPWHHPYPFCWRYVEQNPEAIKLRCKSSGPCGLSRSQNRACIKSRGRKRFDKTKILGPAWGLDEISASDTRCTSPFSDCRRRTFCSMLIRWYTPRASGFIRNAIAMFSPSLFSAFAYFTFLTIIISV